MYHDLIVIMDGFIFLCIQCLGELGKNCVYVSLLIHTIHGKVLIYHADLD